MEASQLNLWDNSFKTINLDQWIDTAQRTVAVNVTQNERLFSMAVEYFEAMMVVYTEGAPNYGQKIALKTVELKAKHLTEPEYERQLATFKLMELVKLIESKQEKKKQKIIDPVTYWKLMDEETKGDREKAGDSDVGRGTGEPAV